MKPLRRLLGEPEEACEKGAWKRVFEPPAILRARACLRVVAGSLPGACILEGQPLGYGPWVRPRLGPGCQPEGIMCLEGDFEF